MDNSKKRLAKCLINPGGNLWFEEPWIYSKLDGLAKDCIELGSVEGALAAVIIYYQLAETILKLLVRLSNFVIEASIYPVTINFKDDEKDNLYRVIKSHEYTINFYRKAQIINRAKKIKKIRDELVHNITENFSEEEIISKGKECNNLFEDLFKYFAESIDWFNNRINKLKKREVLRKLIEKYK